MSQHTSTDHRLDPIPRCLVVISGDPRNDEASLEGMRCALVLAADSRWKLTIGFCEDALGFVRDLSGNPCSAEVFSHPILKQWSQLPGKWCYLSQPRADGEIELPERALSASEWLEMGILQSHVFYFGIQADRQ
ncbi:MAG: hypothetical protein HN610_01840 [Verrucomicrobia bacterium]|nr:hypothetical protein [Verrucomicrobiota bacterium]MBT7534282.1 hypothetical protein [Verrucomicrobiota bacterium]